MVDELTVVGAYLWRQLGNRPASQNQAEGALSYELRLFKPSEAKAVLEALLARELFVRNGDKIAGTSGLLPIDVPLGFRPSAQFLSTLTQPSEGSLMDEILGFLKPQLSEADRVTLGDEIALTAQHLGVSQESAALLVGWRKGLRDPRLVQEYLSSLFRYNPAR